MKDKTEFLERIGVFPLVQGSVITLDPNVGAEIDIEGIETSGVCPLSQLRGMIVGEEGLFFMTHYGEDGALVVSYQKAAQYEALYNEALANAIHYVSVREATEADRADGLEGARASFSGGLLRDVVGVVPSWAASGVDLANQGREKIEVAVFGIYVQEDRLVALLSRNRAKAIRSFFRDSGYNAHDSEQLTQYRALLKKRNFMMGRVKELSEKGAIVEFEFGLTGLLDLQELQEGEVLEPAQSIGVLIKAYSEEAGLLLTRRPLSVLTVPPWE